MADANNQPAHANLNQNAAETHPLRLFRERKGYAQTGTAYGYVRTPETLQNTVELHTAGDQEFYSLIATMFHEIENCDDNFQMCAYYASILNLYLPGLRQTVVEVFREFGYDLQLVQTNAEREATQMINQPPMDAPLALMYFGQSILIMFKQIQDLNYQPFMSRRTPALCAAAGVPMGTAVVTMIPIRKAAVIKSTLGSSHRLKRELLFHILARSEVQSGDVISAVLSYVKNILSWTEMASLMFIHETLLTTRSAALREPSLKTELSNLLEAYTEVARCEYPQYFRIIEHPARVAVTERARFPTIISLARALKARRSMAANQFVAPLPSNNQNIVRLLEIHDAYMESLQPLQSRVINALFNTDDDFDAEFNPGEA